MRSEYRGEIDGLRALAVLPVVLFHAGLGPQGGFLGVDIFYVISGYLITSIIYKDFFDNKFNYYDFYERRIRRIIPLLLVVIFISTIFGWITFSDIEFKGFGKSVISVLLFISNLYFWKTTSYFNSGSENIPLLHTWSLAVEEQFYIIFPALFLLLGKYFRKNLYWIVVGLLLADLAFAHILSLKNPNLSFYMIPSRAWELLAGAAGGIFVQNHDRQPNILLAASGLLLILAAYGLGSSQMVHPGLATVPTVLGSVLVLTCAETERGPGRLLAFGPVALIGKISYGVYLWHQPVLAFARLWSPEPLFLWMKIALVVVTCVLAYLTWRFIEEPFRNRRLIAKTPLYVSLAAAAGVLAMSGLAFAKLPQTSLSHLPLRPAHEVTFIDDRDFCPKTFTYASGAEKGCFLGVAGVSPEVAIIGDSHAGMLLGALDGAARAAGISIADLSVDGCVQVADLEYRRFTGQNCGPLQAAALKAVVTSANIKSVILINRWAVLSDDDALANRNPYYKGHKLSPGQVGSTLAPSMHDLVTSLLRAGKAVIVIYPIPKSDWNTPTYLQARFLNGHYEDISISYQTYRDSNAATITALDTALAGLPVAKIYPDKVFCNRVVFNRCMVSLHGESLYIDDNHLSRNGAELLVVPLMQSFDVSGKHATPKQ